MKICLVVVLYLLCIQDKNLFATLFDRADRLNLKNQAPETLKKIDENKLLNKQDLINMIRSGLSIETIIDQIKDTNTTLYLSAQEIIDLKNEGISQSAIDALTNKKSSS